MVFGNDPQNFDILHDFAFELLGASIFFKIRFQLHRRTFLRFSYNTLWPIFIKISFDLCNTVKTFHRLMNDILHQLPFVYAYTDKILITSVDITSHKQHLHEVLQRLLYFSFRLNRDKCVFDSSQIDFLGVTLMLIGLLHCLRRWMQPRTFQYQHLSKNSDILEEWSSAINVSFLTVLRF